MGAGSDCGAVVQPLRNVHEDSSGMLAGRVDQLLCADASLVGV